MKIDITAQPIFWVEMTSSQLAILRYCSNHHYDATCKAMSDNIAEGGVKKNGSLTEWGFSVTSETGGMVRAEFHDLDLCLKLLEIADYLPALSAETPKIIVKEIRRSFCKALMLASRELSNLKIQVEGA